jgi:hypothetical protein
MTTPVPWFHQGRPELLSKSPWCYLSHHCNASIGQDNAGFRQRTCGQSTRPHAAGKSDPAGPSLAAAFMWAIERGKVRAGPLTLKARKQVS